MKLLRAVISTTFLWSLIVGAATVAGSPESVSLEQILRRMDEHDRAMSSFLKRYTCLRRYTLVNQRFHKKAELNVRMTYVAPGHKSFEVLSEQGPSILRQKVLRPMLEAETEAGRDDVRPNTRIVASNYDFKLLGLQVQQGRQAYLLEVIPKTRNKFLIRGRVWVDAEDFGIIRVEAVPAQNPSVFIHNTRVVQQSSRYGDVWLPQFNHSNTDSFLFGHTEVTIDSWDYKISEKATDLSSVLRPSPQLLHDPDDVGVRDAGSFTAVD